MALGKGGIHHEGAEKGNAGQGGWGKKCKKKMAGVKQMLIKGWHQQNFHSCLPLQGSTDDIGGCQDPISSLISLPQFFPPPCILMPRGSLSHMSLGPMLPCIPGLMGMAHMSLAPCA